MMKKLLLGLLLLTVGLLASPAQAQTTLASATITDANSTPYANGSWSAQHVNPTGLQSFYGGVPLLKESSDRSGSLDSTGSFTNVSFYDIAFIFNGGQASLTTYTFRVCSAPVMGVSGTLSKTCFSVAGVAVTGASQSLSTTISAGASLLYGINVPSMKVGPGGLTFPDLTVQKTAGGGGGGLADPGSNGIIKRTALNVTAIATSTDVIGLWTGTCNSTTFMRADGSCQTTGSGISGLTTGVIPQASSATAIANSSPQLDNGVTTANTLTFAGTGGFVASAGPLQSSSDGTHAGRLSAIGNTTNPTSLPANTYSVLGPLSASFTAWAEQPPATGPASACLPHLAALATIGGLANVSAETCSAVNLAGGANEVTGVLPSANVGVSATAPITESGGGAFGCATCVTSAAALTSGRIMEGAGSQASAVDAALDDGVTTSATLTYSGIGGITASAGPFISFPQLSAGSLQLSGNGTAPTLTANSASIIGPSSASFTATALRLPTAYNAGVAGIAHIGAASSSISALTSSAINLAGGANEVTGILPAGNLPATLVYTNQTNAYAAFLQDFTSGTMEIPEAAGFTTNVNSTIGLDLTANLTHLYSNNADSIAAVTTSTTTTTTQALFATAVAGIYNPRAIASGDLPATAFPVTVSGTVNSGGIPCFNSPTNEQTSVALTVNVLPKGGGAGACPTNSSITDNGTTVATPEELIITQTTGTGAAESVVNSTVATSSTAQSSPFYGIGTGQFWYNPDFNTGSPPIAAVSAPDCWTHQIVETNGSNGTSTYALTHNGASPNCAGSPAPSFLLAPYSESYGVTTLTVAQASAPTVAVQGATGAATWTYAIVACTGPTCSNVSATTSVANGVTPLTTSNWNKITWSATPNADYYQVYRTVSGGTPASLGAICKIPAGATLECDDKALTGDATTAQAYNATGQMCLGSCPKVGGGTGGGMFGTNGTAPSSNDGTGSGWYGNSTNSCLDIVNVTTDVGCAAAVGKVTVYGAFLQLPTANTATLASDFTDANAAGLQAITGLSFTLLANTAYKYKVDCDLMWSQATNVADTFGVQDVTVAPTRIDGYGLMSVAGPAAAITNSQYGVLTNLTTTTATGIVTATPTVTTVNFAQLHFVVQQPSNASTSVLQIMVQQATAADVIVVRAGSSCRIQ